MNLNDTSRKAIKNETQNTEVLIWVKTGIIILVCIELLIAVFNNSFFSFLCFTTILFVIFPTITTLFKKYLIKENKNVFKIIVFFHWVGKKGHELLIRNFTFLQQNDKKYLIISLLFIIGHLMFGNSFYKTNIEKQEEILQQYLIKNKTDKSLKNIRLLAEIGELFDNSNYSLENPHDGYTTRQRDLINKNNTVFVFNPKIDFLRIRELKYLKPEEQRGELEDYYIKFIFNDDNEIISKKSFLKYSNAGIIEFLNDSIPDLSLLLDAELIENAKLNKEAEEQNERNLEAFKQRQNEFEERCMSSWDGSHIELVKSIKKNMNDPESFEHVETSYGLQKDYAIIVMQFRGRNAFGGLVLNSVKATVSLDDCSVLSIEE